MRARRGPSPGMPMCCHEQFVDQSCTCHFIQIFFCVRWSSNFSAPRPHICVPCASDHQCPGLSPSNRWGGSDDPVWVTKLSVLAFGPYECSGALEQKHMRSNRGLSKMACCQWWLWHVHVLVRACARTCWCVRALCSVRCPVADVWPSKCGAF